MHMQIKYFQIQALICCSVFLGAYCQVPFNAPCPEVKLMQTFDLDAYMGVWYSYAKYPFAPAGDRKCNYAKYQNLHNNSISVLNGAIKLDTGLPSNTTGIAYVLGAGQLAVVFNSRQSKDKVNYIVLGSDYANYAVVYNCKNVNSTTITKDAFILTRLRQPCHDVIARAKSILRHNFVDLKYLIYTDQTGCENL